MKFMIIRKADAETEAGARASEALIAAMARYIEEMVEAGVMRMGEGLHPSAEGARVRFTDGKPVVTDGPFAETKELVAGVSIIEVASRAEALEWVKRWPTLDGHGNVEIEVRRVYELDELGSGEGIAEHARLRERMAGEERPGA